MTSIEIRFGVEFEMVIRPKEVVLPLLHEDLGFSLTD